MTFPKKIALEYDFSCCVIWKDDISFFLEIWCYCLDGKWKMFFFKKIHGNMIFSSNIPKRWSFQKKLQWNMIFLVLSGKMILFQRKIYFFLWMENGRWYFFRNTWKYDIFCIYYKCYKYDITLLRKKHQRWSFLEKIHLKVIDILDCILERVPTILCIFGDLHRRFHISLSSEKKNKTKQET